MGVGNEDRAGLRTRTIRGSVRIVTPTIGRISVSGKGQPIKKSSTFSSPTPAATAAYILFVMRNSNASSLARTAATSARVAAKSSFVAMVFG